MRHNKPKDIAEGALPSRARKYARGESRRIHRTQRHRVAQDLRGIRDEDDYIDDAPDIYAHDKRARVDNSYRVRDRRDADNLGALLRWADSKLKHELADLDPEAQYMWFKNFLPDTLQGRHSLGHIASNIEGYGDEFFRFHWYRRNARYPYITFEERFEQLHELFRRGLHGEYNKRVKAASTWAYPGKFIEGYDEGIRHSKELGLGNNLDLIIGIHDIERMAHRLKGLCTGTDIIDQLVPLEITRYSRA